VVTGQSAGPTGKTRPKVAVLDSSGRPAEHIDLTQKRNIAITGAPDPFEASIQPMWAPRPQR
jgi:hypothetical protein